MGPRVSLGVAKQQIQRQGGKKRARIEERLPVPARAMAGRHISQVQLTFLGTCAGKPSSTRNVSSLGLRMDGSTWLFDAGEATQHQLMKSDLKLGSITKLFLTHMHGDHVFGLAPLLLAFGDNDEKSMPPIDIYGPSGVRELIRWTLRLTYSYPARTYRIHELLFPKDTSSLNSRSYFNEIPGQDIWQDENGFWDVCRDETMSVKAGPIKHTIPCLGYVIQEDTKPASISQTQIDLLKANAPALSDQGIKNPMTLLGKLQREREPLTLPDGNILQPPPLNVPGRKIVILGDTYDARAMLPISQGADLVVHEATNAFLPNADPTTTKEGDTFESIRASARAHGHSTPEVAGAFAKEANAKFLVLNHLSSRYSDPQSQLATQDKAEKARLSGILTAIAAIAEEAFGKPGCVKTASDFLTIPVVRASE